MHMRIVYKDIRVQFRNCVVSWLLAYHFRGVLDGYESGHLRFLLLQEIGCRPICMTDPQGKSTDGNWMYIEPKLQGTTRNRWCHSPNKPRHHAIIFTVHGLLHGSVNQIRLHVAVKLGMFPLY